MISEETVTTIDQLNLWLISEGRVLGDETQIVKCYCEELVRLGVQLSRVRIAQTYMNPLLSAWGIIWTPEETRRYTVASDILATDAWYGSPFEHVVTTRTPLRKRLLDLAIDEEHAVYRDLAAAGATDFLAMPLEYGDNSVQGSSFTSNAKGGFSDENIRMIEYTRHALTSALEPIAMRESQRSLLETYLGVGPANEVEQGKIKRGERRTVSAAVLFADLRGFTEKSASHSESQLLDIMGDYFEMIVTPIQNHNGDVLKFMGDGILAVFRTEADGSKACRSAVEAARQSLKNLEVYNLLAKENGREKIEFVVGIDFGEVTFGNIGSPDRLDFTVVGRVVNVASRVQELCKRIGETILVTEDVARRIGSGLPSAGFHKVRGVLDDIEVFVIH